MDEKPSVIDVNEGGVRDLPVASGVARRGQKSSRDETWLPAEALLGSSTLHPRTRRTFGIGTVAGLLALAIILLVAAIGAAALAYTAQNDRQNAQRQVDSALNSSRNDARALANVLNNPDALFLPLTQRDPLRGAAAGFSVVMGGGGRGGLVVVIANNLPPLVTGRAWQAWIAQADGVKGSANTPARITSGPLTADAQGAFVATFAGLNDSTPYKTVFVTEESANGTQEPTGVHLFEAEIAKAVHLRDAGTK